MLAVQEYLKSRSLEELVAEFCLEVTEHGTEPLVILNYNQISSRPKDHEIVRECRGLVLEKGNWDLVARSFKRFFNWGELPELAEKFNWRKFITQEKVDGSLCTFFWWNERWWVTTRGSFAQGMLEPHPFTWEEAITKALGLKDLQELDKVLDRSVTYIGEFCSLFNKVVRRYEYPKVFLLAAFQGENEIPIEKIQTPRGFARVAFGNFSSVEEICQFLKRREQEDSTYEGVVIRDSKFERWKLKTDTYRDLHTLKGNGNIFRPANIVPWVLSGTDDDLVAKLPETREAVERVRETIHAELKTLESIWEDSQGVESQKDFALKIAGRTKLVGILFGLRKKHGPVWGKELLLQEMKEAEEYVTKVLF